MYYEEKLIDGILMFRTSPKGWWNQCSISEMNKRIIALQKENQKLKHALLSVSGKKPSGSEIGA